MKSVRLFLIIAAAVVLALPAVASSAPALTRVSVGPTAQYVTSGQITVDLSLSCEEGLIYGASAVVLQQGPFGENVGSGFTQGRCTGGRQKVAITVNLFSFPGWQLGDAIAVADACAFTCANASRPIRIVL